MKYRGFELGFFVILDVTVNTDKDVSYCGLPIELRKVMELTEHSNECEYGIFDNAIQRKWVGELTEKQMDLMTDYYDLFADEVETGGMLLGFGWLPAISFSSPVYNNFTPLVDENNFIATAYVCPFIESASLTEDHWEEIKELVLDEWGY